MNFLFVHQNFPGQFRHVAQALAADPQHRVWALGQENQVRANAFTPPGLRLVGYKAPEKGGEKTHHYLRDHEAHVRRGQAVVRAVTELRARERFEPDVVIAHPGWGEALFLRDLFPKARLVVYFEYYYQASGGDLGFDGEFPASLDDQLRVRIKNNTQLHSLVSCDLGISPTQWQRSRYPAEFQPRIRVLHEGIATDAIAPDPQVSIALGGKTLTRNDSVVTYVARNLEPYRGFHIFMRSLPRLQAMQPQAQVVIVGGDQVSYGRPPEKFASYRELYCKELGDRVDWSRVHFTGKLAYREYLRVLQVSSVHAYLTYPFVLSWSLLEAMSAGCLVVASDTAPVREVLQHGVNGLTADFFDPDALARQLSDALQNRIALQHMRDAARATVVERFDLRGICLPAALDMLQAS